MNASTQCYSTLKETTDKKTQAVFNGKVKSIQVKPEFKNKSTTTEDIYLGLGTSVNADVSLLSHLSQRQSSSQDNFSNNVCDRLNKSAIPLGKETNRKNVVIGEIGEQKQCVDLGYLPKSIISVGTETFESIQGKTHIIGQIGALKRCADFKSLPEYEAKVLKTANDVCNSEALRQVNHLLCVENRLDLEYHYQHNSTASSSCLTVSRSDMFQDLGGLYEVPVKVQFSSDGIVSVLLTFKPAVRETFFDIETCKIDNSVVFRALNYLNPNNVFCSGIKTEFEFAKATSLDVIHHPCERRQSRHCPIIFRPPKASSPKGEQKLICPKCASLDRYLKRREKDMKATTPRTKLRRRHISSKFPIESLTPKSRRIRIKNIRNDRYRQKTRIARMEKQLKENCVTLNPEQSHEMSQVLKEMNENHKGRVDKIILEVKRRNPLLAQAFRTSWETDSKNSKLTDFINDQAKNPGTSTGNRFSPLTFRLALSLYSRSPASYRTLQGLKIFNLPSVETVKKKLHKIKCGPGIDIEHLKKESARFKATFSSLEKPPPQDGILVMDEVKVIGKMVWNGNSNEFIGLAMNPEEVPSLHNFYKTKSVNNCLKAEYVLQYIWRCAGELFDVVGPYYPSNVPFAHELLTAITQRVTFSFQSVGFIVSAIVCDGASSNLTMIKNSHGVSGRYAFTQQQDGTYDFEISPRVQNSLLPDRWIYYVICPSHQLKNMVNALSHSKEGGTRAFERNGCSFGWKQIEEVEAREIQRRDSKELTQVKGLRHSYIIRDSWTKLNVTPAKILQQLPFLSELYNYTHPTSGDPPKDSKEVLACYDFLFACHLIFEKGLLSHKKTYCVESEPIQNMLKGLAYFEDWAKETIELSLEGKTFLAWQTWDLLRISVYGFIGFVKDYHERYPDSYIYPVKVNGSVVETMFSQLRFITAGKLTGSNFKASRRSFLINSEMKTEVKTGERFYRGTNINIPSILD